MPYTFRAENTFRDRAERVQRERIQDSATVQRYSTQARMKKLFNNSVSSSLEEIVQIF